MVQRKYILIVLIALSCASFPLGNKHDLSVNEKLQHRASNKKSETTLSVIEQVIARHSQSQLEGTLLGKKPNTQVAKMINRKSKGSNQPGNNDESDEDKAKKLERRASELKKRKEEEEKEREEEEEKGRLKEEKTKKREARNKKSIEEKHKKQAKEEKHKIYLQQKKLKEAQKKKRLKLAESLRKKVLEEKGKEEAHKEKAAQEKKEEESSKAKILEEKGKEESRKEIALKKKQEEQAAKSKAAENLSKRNERRKKKRNERRKKKRNERRKKKIMEIKNKKKIEEKRKEEEEKGRLKEEKTKKREARNKKSIEEKHKKQAKEEKHKIYLQQKKLKEAQKKKRLKLAESLRKKVLEEKGKEEAHKEKAAQEKKEEESSKAKILEEKGKEESRKEIALKKKQEGQAAKKKMERRRLNAKKCYHGGHSCPSIVLQEKIIYAPIAVQKRCQDSREKFEPSARTVQDCRSKCLSNFKTCIKANSAGKEDEKKVSLNNKDNNCCQYFSFEKDRKQCYLHMGPQCGKKEFQQYDHKRDLFVNQCNDIIYESQVKSACDKLSTYVIEFKKFTGSDIKGKHCKMIKDFMSTICNKNIYCNENSFLELNEKRVSLMKNTKTGVKRWEQLVKQRMAERNRQDMAARQRYQQNLGFAGSGGTKAINDRNCPREVTRGYTSAALRDMTCDQLKKASNWVQGGMNGVANNYKAISSMDRCNKLKRGQNTVCTHMCAKQSWEPDRVWDRRAHKILDYRWGGKTYRWCNRKCWYLNVYVQIGDSTKEMIIDQISHCLTAGQLKEKIFKKVKEELGVDALLDRRASEYKLHANLYDDRSAIPNDNHPIGRPWTGSNGNEYEVYNANDKLYLTPEIKTFTSVHFKKISEDDQVDLKRAVRSMDQVSKTSLHSLLDAITLLAKMLESLKKGDTGITSSCDLPMQFSNVYESINQHIAALRVTKFSRRRRLLKSDTINPAKEAYVGLVDARYGTCGTPSFINLADNKKNVIKFKPKCRPRSTTLQVEKVSGSTTTDNFLQTDVSYNNGVVTAEFRCMDGSCSALKTKCESESFVYNIRDRASNEVMYRISIHGLTYEIEQVCGGRRRRLLSRTGVMIRHGGNS